MCMIVNFGGLYVMIMGWCVCSDQNSVCCKQCQFADRSKVCYSGFNDCQETTYCEYPLSIDVVNDCNIYQKIFKNAFVVFFVT